MKAELKTRIYAYNTARKAVETQRDSLQSQVTALTDSLTASTETMRTIANLFSASAWAILPSKIKAYFEKYREE